MTTQNGQKSNAKKINKMYSTHKLIFHVMLSLYMYNCSHLQGHSLASCLKGLQ